MKPESHVHVPTAASTTPWWAFTDGYVMPQALSRMFAAGRFNHVACLIGTCRDEGMSFTRRMPDLTVEIKDYLRKYYSPVSLKMFAIYPGENVGQHEAVTAICKALRRSRADLKDPRRPIGTFLLLGPTGVGGALWPRRWPRRCSATQRRSFTST